MPKTVETNRQTAKLLTAHNYLKQHSKPSTLTSSAPHQWQVLQWQEERKTRIYTTISSDIDLTPLHIHLLTRSLPNAQQQCRFSAPHHQERHDSITLTQLHLLTQCCSWLRYIGCHYWIGLDLLLAVVNLNAPPTLPNPSYYTRDNRRVKRRLTLCRRTSNGPCSVKGLLQSIATSEIPFDLINQSLWDTSTSIHSETSSSSLFDQLASCWK